MRPATLALLLLLLLPVAAELGLRLAAPRPGTDAWRPGASVRVLCLGDSLPYGSRVDADEAFPAQLQELLDARSPGRFSVINLALPGMNTTQVRRRLAGRVMRYGPDLVLVMAGANNARNDSEVALAAPGPWRTRLAGLASRSALYRALRLGPLPGAAAVAPDTRADGRRQVSELEPCGGEDCQVRATWRLRHGGRVERIEMHASAAPDRAQAEQRAVDDFLAMADWLEAAGIPLVLVGYPRDGVPPLALANRALARVRDERGIRVVETRDAAARAGGPWPDSLHPNPRVHREIAIELAALLEQADACVARPSAPPATAAARGRES